jgi:hypothetical protein
MAPLAGQRYLDGSSLHTPRHRPGRGHGELCHDTAHAVCVRVEGGVRAAHACMALHE